MRWLVDTPGWRPVIAKDFGLVPRILASQLFDAGETFQSVKVRAAPVAVKVRFFIACRLLSD